MKKNQNHSCPHQNKSLPEANSAAGKAKVHFKVNSGVAQCVNLMKYAGKGQDMSNSDHFIKTLWESIAITLWAKWLSKEIPLKASHRGLLWPSVFCSSSIYFLLSFLHFLHFLCSWFYLSLSLSCSSDCSFSLLFILPLSPLFCSLFFPSTLPRASMQCGQRMEPRFGRWSEGLVWLGGGAEANNISAEMHSEWQWWTWEISTCIAPGKGWKWMSVKWQFQHYSPDLLYIPWASWLGVCCHKIKLLIFLVSYLHHQFYPTFIFYPSSPPVFLHPKEKHFKDIKGTKSDKSALWGVFSFYENWQKSIDGNCLRGKFNFQISFLVSRQHAYFPVKT